MSKPLAYYNEIDPAAAHVLRTLIDANVIAPGVVDTRSIKEVHPDDLNGFTQCHFFAGGGLWSVAARLAGWPDERPIWSGSCPCQGEGLAGKRMGASDPRHLWPDFFRLIRAARPAVVVGEQVAAAAGTHWLDGVASDLESENYASGAVDIPACAVDAPHIRSRLYWCAVADGSGAGLEEYTGHGDASRGSVAPGSIAAPDGRNGLYADADGRGRAGRQESEIRQEVQRAIAERDLPRINGTHWSDAEWIICHDGKARRTKSGLRLLANGIPGRVDLWRIAGNAIVPQIAAEVLASLMDVLPDWRTAA